MNVDIPALAKLARIELSEAEITKLQSEFPALLEFVEAIARADISGVKETKALRNVMREDTGAHESGIYTEALLSQAPRREGDTVAVKQVVSRQKHASE
ncbi:MAG TPA: Asp-tRNA(Asn)/Glu-tRNA(Gln) amidotransferase subunit GatC [Candidatus Paceibacterota bacterium]|jgi:aspartyl/glutamyl-tRNA(Asn/Gln) amidotransferase C subunit|nr:Asp-tRNA(Asn)/Glu-tRNA(Gln) amidotransferase subunit GatC [Candidatus Paceibacterota bacterium]